MKNLQTTRLIQKTILTILGLAFTLFFTTQVNKKIVLATDFIGLYTGAQIAKSNELPFLYELEIQKKHQEPVLGKSDEYKVMLPYRPLPLVAIVLMPLAYLSFVSAYQLFTVFIVFCLLLICLKIIDTFPLLGKFAGLPLLVFFYFPNIRSMLQAHYTPLLALFLILIYKCLKNGEGIKAGIYSSLMLLKFQHITIVPFLFIITRKKKEFLKGFMPASAVFMTLSFLFVGFSGTQDFLNFIQQTEGPDFGSRYWHMIGIYPLLLTINLSQTVSIIIWLIIYIILLVIFKKIKKSHNLKWLLSLAILFGVITAPHVLIHDLSLLTVPLLLTAESALENKDRQLLFVITAIYLSSYLFIFSWFPMFYTLLIVAFSLILVFKTSLKPAGLLLRRSRSQTSIIKK